MKKIAVPEEGLETLFGAYDENLKQLEALFGVRIRTQGNEVTVDGDPAAVRKAERTLTELATLVQEGYRLSNGDVKTAAAVDLMSGAPSGVDDKQLRELRLKIAPTKT